MSGSTLPARPWEACGTSGMKVLVNGGLNLSELDGWWAEAYTPKSAGRWVTDGSTATIPAGMRPKRSTLYDILEHEVIPRFYHRDATDSAHGSLDARKHGALDAALFGEPRRARIHRDLLP